MSPRPAAGRRRAIDDAAVAAGAACAVRNRVRFVVHAGDHGANLVPGLRCRRKAAEQSPTTMSICGGSKRDPTGAMRHNEAKARIEQLEAAVAAEHGDPLAQRVECFALHADQRVVTQFHVEALGHVVEQIGDAPLRVGIDDGAQGASVRQIPDMLGRIDRLVERQEAGLPSAEIDLFGQPALGSQAIENHEISRPLVEESGVEIPQLAIGGIVKHQPLGAVEHGDGDRQLVERARMRLHLPAEIGAHQFEFGNIGRKAGGTGRRRNIDHIEGAAVAGDDGADARMPDGAFRA